MKGFLSDEAADYIQHALPSLFKNVDTAVIVANLQREIVFLNEEAIKLFGYRIDELRGRTTKVLYANAADYLEQGKKRFNAESEPTSSRYVVEYVTKSGLVFQGETHGGPVLDGAGKPILLIGFIKDVTVRLEAERVLNELHSITSSRSLNFENRVKSILNLGSKHFGLPIGIFSRISDNTYTVNQAIHPENALQSGMTFDLGGTYCSHVYNANDVQGFHYVAESEISDHPCYQNFGLEAYLGAPIFVDGERYGTLNFSSPNPTRPFTHQDIELVRLFSEWIGHELARVGDLQALKDAQQKLEAIANTDVLTGLYNRRSLEKTLEIEIARCKRYHHALTIAIIDFDHFKQVNDLHGHAAGDAALRHFADIALQQSRDVDIFGRWGGEEFLAVFPDTNLEGALITLERIQSAIRNQPLDFKEITIPLSVSVGCSLLKDGDGKDSLLHRADEALYIAKENGRDRIEYL